MKKTDKKTDPNFLCSTIPWITNGALEIDSFSFTPDKQIFDQALHCPYKDNTSPVRDPMKSACRQARRGQTRKAFISMYY